MKYKAKKSYKDLPMTKNYHAFGSDSKHIKLMAGEEVECTPPKSLIEHLETSTKIEKKGNK